MGADHGTIGIIRMSDPLPTATISLGEYLAAIRSDRKLTLRQVEEATQKQVSNAYLSQLENGHVKQPSPHILHCLADLYAVEYTALMQIAGYLKSSGTRKEGERHGRVTTFSELDLTPEEEAELFKYLRFLRNEKK